MPTYFSCDPCPDTLYLSPHPDPPHLTSGRPSVSRGDRRQTAPSTDAIVEHVQSCAARSTFNHYRPWGGGCYFVARPLACSWPPLKPSCCRARRACGYLPLARRVLALPPTGALQPPSTEQTTITSCGPSTPMSARAPGGCGRVWCASLVQKVSVKHRSMGA